MKQFFKFVFASCFGTILAFLGLFLILCVIGAVMSAGDTGFSDGSVLKLELNHSIPERSGNVANQGFSFDQQLTTGLHDIVKLIEHAKQDASISGIIYTTAPETPIGTVTASTIREALKDFRDSSDKFVYAYGDFFNNTSYLVASSADSIFANPMGMVDVNGYAAMLPFFKGTMEKLGVKMNIFYAGQFKSATEPFRRKDMSEQNKQQTREYLTDNFNLYLEEVSDSRNIPESAIKNIVNDLSFDNTQAALDNGLVDGLWHWYEVEDHLRKLLGKKEGRMINYVTIDEYAGAVSLSKGTGSDKIAVIYAEGEVVYDNEDKGNINESTYHKVFDKIRKDKKVKAVVLRVNSPGGSAFTSDVILKELKELQKKGLPIIASFGDYAASGGYYIAASADTIVAHPKTLTGSIGVFSMLPDFTDAMEDKLGITFDTVKTSPHAIVMSPFYHIGEEEKVVLQESTDKIYNQFLQRVSEGRNRSIDDVHQVAQGRVWTGSRAVEKGLVDVMGGLDTAIEIAAEAAEIEDYKLVEYPVIEQEIWEQLMMELGRSGVVIAAPKMTKEEAKIYKSVTELQEMMKYREPIARLPFMIYN